MTDNSLSHYGVKGMRWGVRRERKLAKERAKSKELEDKAASIIRSALKDPNTKINVNGKAVISGKEFTEAFFSGQLTLNVEKSNVVNQKPGR